MNYSNKIINIYWIKLKKFWKSDSNRIILSNSTALLILQIANFILPLINIPYLLKVLGPLNYGTVTYAISIVAFMQIATDYGFNLSATREISIAKDEKEINKIFTSVIVCKAIIGLFCLIVGIISINLLGLNHDDKLVYYICFGNILSSVLISTWLFQGKQCMKYITVINVISKLIMTTMIFFLVKHEDDYLTYAIITILSSILIGFLGQLVVYCKLRVRYIMITPSDICKQFSSGWDLFISTIMSSMISNAGIFILGFTNGKEAVAFFSASDKLVRAIPMVFSPFTQSIYPEANKRFTISFHAGYIFVIKVLRIILIPLLVICLLLAVFSKIIFMNLYDSRYWTYSAILSIQCMWVLFAIINNFLGIQIMVGSGHYEDYKRAFLYSSCLSVFLFVLLSSVWQGYGIAIGMLTGELLLSLLLLLGIEKLRKLA